MKKLYEEKEIYFIGLSKLNFKSVVLILWQQHEISCFDHIKKGRKYFSIFFEIFENESVSF